MKRFKIFLRRLPWEKTLLAFAGFFFIILIAGFIPISHDGLRRLVVSQALGRGLDRFALDRLSLTLWRGVRLGGLRVALTLPEGQLIEADVPLAVVSYSIFPLVFRHVHIKKFLLDGPRIKITLPAGGGRPKKSAAPPGGPAIAPAPLPFTLTCRKIAVEKGEAALFAQGKRMLWARGVGVSGTLSARGGAHLSGAVEVRRSLLQERFEAEKIRVDFSATPERVAVERFEGKLFGGRFHGRTELYPLAARLAYFDVDAEDLKLKDYYSATGIGYGKLTGSLNLSFRLGKSGLTPDSLAGKGKVVMTKVRLEDLPLQRSPLIKVSMPELAQITFETIRGDLALRRGRAHNTPVAGRGSPMDFDATGWVGLDGFFDQTLDARLTPDFARRLPQLVRNGLVVRPDGSYGLKLYLSGTMENPKVRLDRQNVNQAIGRSLQSLGRGLRRFLK